MESKRLKLVKAIYESIAQLSPARPFVVPVNPLILALQHNFNQNEAIQLIDELSSNGLLMIDRSRSKAYITPKTIKFLQSQTVKELA